jgi:hypothetical protein
MSTKLNRRAILAGRRCLQIRLGRPSFAKTHQTS